MSTSKITYIGPYVKLDPQIFEKQYLRQGCSNNCNLNYSDSQYFCQKCGNKLEPILYTRKEDNINSILYEDFENQLVLADHNEVIVLIPNHKVGDNKERDLSDIFSTLIQEELCWFHQKYKDILEALSNPNVSKSLTVYWGVVTYYN